MNQPHILMCPPDYYGIEYEINPWMNRERKADHPVAARQWTALREILEGLGAKISLLEPQVGLPDLVFTANAAMIFRGRAIVSRFRHAQRQGEELYDSEWLSRNEFAVEYLDEGMYFEGAGDALFCGDTLFAGYRMRSDVTAHQHVAKRIDVQVIPLELVDPYYYHLDTCFCPLSSGLALYYSGAFDDYGLRALDQHVDRLIDIEADEARNFAANAVVVGETVVTNRGCPSMHERLRAEGFKTVETPLDEFVKAGGSAKCLTLRLDGEEAAGWKHDRTEHN
ncbi:MAG: arginine deiminase-related protein [Pirellulales bacterium]|nr:arginine deiminase-related protein [Pirellulales bacterium]